MASSSLTEDYYDVLGVPRNADTLAIRASYRRLAMLRHPDKNNGNDKATADFQLLHSAYETLSDVARRRVYDRRYRPAHTCSQATHSSCPEAATHGADSTPTGTQSSNSDEHRRRMRELSRKLARQRVARNACEVRYVAIHFEADELRDQLQRIAEGLARAGRQMLPGPVPYQLDQWITGQYAERKNLEDKLELCAIETTKLKSRLAALNSAINVTAASMAEITRARGRQGKRHE